MMRELPAIGLLALLLAPAAAAQSRPAEADVAPQCRTAEHHQFDCWLGDCDVYDVPDTTRLVAALVGARARRPAGP